MLHNLLQINITELKKVHTQINGDTHEFASLSYNILKFSLQMFQCSPHELNPENYETVNARAKEEYRLQKKISESKEGVRVVIPEKSVEEAVLAISRRYDSLDIHALIGGQGSADKEHKLYMLYPQGNWVEIGEGSPYQIIGATAYGKPVLDRTLNHEITAWWQERLRQSMAELPLDPLSNILNDLGELL